MCDINRLTEDISKYLQAKFPDVDITASMESAEYISNRVWRFLQTALLERDKEWKSHIEKESRRSYRGRRTDGQEDQNNAKNNV